MGSVTTLCPAGFAVVGDYQHCSKRGVFLHPGTSGPALSLAADLSYLFPVITESLHTRAGRCCKRHLGLRCVCPLIKLYL